MKSTGEELSRCSLPGKVLEDLGAQVHRAGGDAAGFFAALGEPTPCMGAVRRRVPGDLFGRGLALAVELTGRADLALRLGLEDVGSGSPLLDFLVMSAETVEDALVLFARYAPLAMDGVALDYQQSDGGRTGVLVLRQTEGEGPLPACLAAWVTGVVLGLLRGQELTVRGALRARAAEFAHAATSGAPAYERVLGVAPTWRARRHALVFDRESLDRLLRRRDSGLLAKLRREADVALRELRGGLGYGERVRRLLPELMSEGVVSLEETARRLGVSGRTLQRRLKEEASEDFNALLDGVRRERCLRELSKPALRIEEVAVLAGYTESSAFYRSFRRWTGMTPVNYRRARENGVAGRVSAGVAAAA